MGRFVLRARTLALSFCILRGSIGHLGAGAGLPRLELELLLVAGQKTIGYLVGRLVGRSVRRSCWPALIWRRSTGARCVWTAMARMRLWSASRLMWSNASVTQRRTMMFPRAARGCLVSMGFAVAYGGLMVTIGAGEGLDFSLTWRVGGLVAGFLATWRAWLCLRR